MVSEDVEISIERRDGEGDGLGDGLAADSMIGHVAASFEMRNEGNDSESMEVWFPLGDEWTLGAAESIGFGTRFRAWVDGEEATVSEKTVDDDPDEVVTWATWPATFAPGETVALEVEYDLIPEGYAPYGTFRYLLRTGSGWWGPIGEARVTVRLPYDVNTTNTVLTPTSAWETSPRPMQPDVVGPEAVWSFSELEPSADSDIRLTVLTPDRWTEIVAARGAAVEAPDSLEAQHRLGLALADALTFKQGLIPIGRSEELVAEATEAYRTALKLDPDNLAVRRDYLDLMFNQCCCPCSSDWAPDDLVPVLEASLGLAPDDEDLLALSEELQIGSELSATMVAGVQPSSTDEATTATRDDRPDADASGRASDESATAATDRGSRLPCGSGAIVLALAALALVVRRTVSAFGRS
jgi:hypothetical protein